MVASLRNPENFGLIALLGGLSTLASNRRGVGAGQALGQGLLGGLSAFAQLRQGEQRQKLQELQIDQATADLKARQDMAKALQPFVGNQPQTGLQASIPTPAQAGTAMAPQLAGRTDPLLAPPQTGASILQGPPVAPGQQQATVTGSMPATTATPPALAGIDPTTARLIGIQAAGDPGAAVGSLIRARNVQATREARRPSSQEGKINEIMGTFGVDRRTAAGIATGVILPKTNPVLGTTDLVNMVEGTTTPLVSTQQAQAQPQPPGGRTLFERTDQTTGLGPAIEETAQRLFGQFLDVGSSEATQARQTLRAEQGNLVRALSINPRFPVAEMERIRNEINIAPSIIDSPPAMRDRMIGVDDSLATRQANEERAAQNNSLPAKTRQDAASAAQSIANFRTTLGVPPLINSDEEFDQLPAGAEFRTKDGKLRIKP